MGVFAHLHGSFLEVKRLVMGKQKVFSSYPDCLLFMCSHKGTVTVSCRYQNSQALAWFQAFFQLSGPFLRSVQIWRENFFFQKSILLPVLPFLPSGSWAESPQFLDPSFPFPCITFEPTCAAVGSYASLSVCLSLDQKSLDNDSYVSTTKGARVTKFGMGLCLADIWVDLKGQGHRSKVKGQGHQAKKCLKVTGQ